MNVLNELKKVNEKRSLEGFNTALSDWSLSQWSNAVAGESGELCNIIKKVERGDFHKKPENASDDPEFNNAYAEAQYREEIGKEAADIVIYLDLLCSREGLDLGSEIVKKFNEVSIKMNCNIVIPV
jgi:NTP pyrophosphatase (non-canonical NTP hydrolase)